MFGYIYLVRNKVNNKQYIGQKHAEEFDPNYYGSGVYLKRALEKYGIENFEHVKILEWCNSKEELDASERYWIDYYNAVESDMFYNLAKGGIGTIAGSKRSDSFKQKIRESTSKRVWTPEARLNASKAIQGRVWIHKEDKSKLIYPEEAEYLIQNEGWTYGRPEISEETRQLLIIASHKRAPMSLEERERLSRQLKEHPIYRPLSKEMQEYVSSIRRDRVWINKDGINKTVKSNELDKYLSNGWVKGMLKKKRSSTTIES